VDRVHRRLEIQGSNYYGGFDINYPIFVWPFGATLYKRPQKVYKVPMALIGDRTGDEASTKVMDNF
jgi:hypothetical protein